MPNNPNAVKNLIPCKKGQTANPNGRPKGTKNFSTRIKELLAGMSSDNNWISPIAAEKIKIAFAKNKNGNYMYPAELRNRVLNEILERTEGKVKDKVELTGEDGDPIQNNITIEFVEPKKHKKRKTKK